MASDTNARPSTSSPLILALAWLGVGLPLLWGVVQTIHKAALLFR